LSLSMGSINRWCAPDSITNVALRKWCIFITCVPYVAPLQTIETNVTTKDMKSTKAASPLKEASGGPAGGQTFEKFDKQVLIHSSGFIPNERRM